MTPELAALLVFALVLAAVGAVWAAAWWAGRTFGADDDNDTIGLP